MGEKKIPEIETHVVDRPRSSRNSGAERSEDGVKVSIPAPELIAQVVPPTRTAVDFGSQGSWTSFENHALFLSPRNFRTAGGRLDRAFISGRGCHFRSERILTRPEIPASKEVLQNTWGRESPRALKFREFSLVTFSSKEKVTNINRTACPEVGAVKQKSQATHHAKPACAHA
jgi:hypothetical protein